ncbi:MAG: YidC/Oxa1 family membrane protein insertase [Acidimicrobiales bacterium]
MILGSIITTIITPFADIFGQVLAAFYSFTHSFGLSIILLTLAAMVLVFPLTRAGTRSMMRMQILQPELLKIRNRYKNKPGMAAEERQANRLKLNEEMMALYRENGVNPTGGCLPMFMQFPIFILLYNVIRGMTRTITVHGHTVLSPQYIPKSALFNAVVHSHGQLMFLGLNLADSVRTPGPIVSRIPYVIVILIAVVLQYISIWQITNRNPSAAQANPQMQAVQKFMPLIFVFLYIVLPAGVGVYFIVSSLFRVGQQEYMYKHDPKIVASVKEIHTRRAIDASAKPGKGGGAASTATTTKGQRTGKPQLGKSPWPFGSTAPLVNGQPRKGLRDRLRDAAAGFQGNLPSERVGGASPKDAGTESVVPTTPAGKNGSSQAESDEARARANQNRSRAKRPRRT